MKKKRIGGKNLWVEKTPFQTTYTSYETPIVVIRGNDFYETSNWYSQTTTRHQNYIKSLYPSAVIIPTCEETLMRMKGESK